MTKDEKWLLEEKYRGARTQAFEEDCKRLARGEPLAYIVGWQPFLGLKIYLDSKPLILRPETEWWTEQLLNTLQDEPASPGAVVRLGLAARSATAPGFAGEAQLRFLDLCAGSGAIGLAALARLPSARVYFGEIDPAHEATIRKNIFENRLDASRADIRIGNLFEPFSAEGGPASGGEPFEGKTFDIIAANPPYIPDARKLPPSVSSYEPARALRAGSDGLAVIRRIATELPKYLARGGVAYIECDSAHAEVACALFWAQGLVAHVLDDQYNRPRVIVASFP